MLDTLEKLLLANQRITQLEQQHAEDTRLLREALFALDVFAEWSQRIEGSNKLGNLCPLVADPMFLATLVATPIHHRDPVIRDLRIAERARAALAKALEGRE